MPSETYRAIWLALKQRQRIVFSYQRQPRDACPIILGYKADGREAVSVYQVGGKSNSGGELPEWRCFDVAGISELATRQGEWREGESHKRTQSCVDWVDVDVNRPETLTQDEPLPFGSPKLRPPRRSK